MKKAFLVSIGSFLIFPVLTLAHAGEENYGHMMDWHWGGNNMMGGSIFGALGLLTWVVWLIVGVLAIVWLWQRINKK